MPSFPAVRIVTITQLIECIIIIIYHDFLPTPRTGSHVKKGKVFYGQEPPSGESTTTECGFNYQLLAVIY